MTRLTQWIIRAQGTFIAIAFLAGCIPSPPRAAKQETPAFSTLEIPNSSGNGWTTYSPVSPPPEILPVKGRAVKVWFYAPLGSVFDVSLRALDGSLTRLSENHGAQEPPENGFFQVLNVNAGVSPPLYTAYVRTPLSLTDQGNYDILVVNKSLRTDVMDSDAMALPLRARKIYMVSVQVAGAGHVTSSPAGIECGISPSGRPLTQCSHDFGAGSVTLLPGANDLTTTKFIGWGGNCDPNTQVCSLVLNGDAALNATANFGARGTVVTPSACPAAPLLPGLRWIDLPACATGHIDSHPGISNPALCDAQGYFCCEPGPQNVNAPRCGGSGKIESAPDCLQHQPTGTLRQPGGCYEVL